MDTLSSKIYKKDFISTFKGDDSGNLQPRQTPGVLYAKAHPSPVKKPVLLAWSDELAADLQVAKPENEADLNILAGNLVTSSMYPYAACYAGHQFGQWAGQLGDGRAITLGEWQSPDGKIMEMQLKGAGPTAYSRKADGRAVLRSSLREFLMSEAMFHLRVPTTRALSLVSTGDAVMRDMFYDGHPAFEPGAVVMRVAPSFLRFGNFEILAARREAENLKMLTDWTIERFYPHIRGGNKVLDWFKEVVERTAVLMVQWLRVGFVHGVMNTDNMSVLGLTIDYGPYSFLDNYDPSFTPNTTDLPGRRYAFGQQASIAYWNLGCLASAIAPLLADTEELVKELEAYQDIFWLKYYEMMGDKLGFDQINPDDITLIDQFEQVLTEISPDMTIFYSLLADLPAAAENEQQVIDHFKPCFYTIPEAAQQKELFDLITEYRRRITMNSCTPQESTSKMKRNNPRFILRNYLLHQAIEELEKGDDALFIKLREAIKNPYSDKFDEFFKIRPSWADQKAGSSMLSCSS